MSSEGPMVALLFLGGVALVIGAVVGLAYGPPYVSGLILASMGLGLYVGRREFGEFMRASGEGTFGKGNADWVVPVARLFALLGGPFLLVAGLIICVEGISDAV